MFVFLSNIAKCWHSLMINIKLFLTNTNKDKGARQKQKKRNTHLDPCVPSNQQHLGGVDYLVEHGNYWVGY